MFVKRIICQNGCRLKKGKAPATILFSRKRGLGVPIQIKIHIYIYTPIFAIHILLPFGCFLFLFFVVCVGGVGVVMLLHYSLVVAPRWLLVLCGALWAPFVGGWVGGGGKVGVGTNQNKRQGFIQYTRQSFNYSVQDKAPTYQTKLATDESKP